MAYDLASYMNPLTLFERGVAVEVKGVKAAATAIKNTGAALLDRGERDAAKGVKVLGKAAGDATEPLAASGAILGKGLYHLGDAAEDLGQSVTAVGNKIFTAEIVTVAVGLLGIAAAWWIASKSSGPKINIIEDGK